MRDGEEGGGGFWGCVRFLGGMIERSLGMQEFMRIS